MNNDFHVTINGETLALCKHQIPIKFGCRLCNEKLEDFPMDESKRGFIQGYKAAIADSKRVVFNIHTLCAGNPESSLLLFQVLELLASKLDDLLIREYQ